MNTLKSPKGKQPSRVLELRAAEGGADARLFVADLALAYQRCADRAG